MKLVTDQYAVDGELLPVEFFPPNDHCGWYGLVIKPKWMPKWMAWLFRNYLPTYLGWMNMPSCKEPYDNPANERYWWIYPTGNNFDEMGNHVRGQKVKPFLWCKLRYVGRVVDIHGNIIKESEV